jgi:murein endopeptidase
MTLAVAATTDIPTPRTHTAKRRGAERDDPIKRIAVNPAMSQRLHGRTTKDRSGIT